MNPFIVVFALICFTLVAAIVIRNMVCPGRQFPIRAEWIQELSTERYKPMLRLLDDADLDFLRSQPGFTPEMLSKLRRERCLIFRGYLRELRRDFARVCVGLKLLMVQASCDRPDLASTMLRSQLAFAYGMGMVQVRLALYVFGLGTVNAADLLNVFNGMGIELRSLVPLATPAGA